MAMKVICRASCRAGAVGNGGSSAGSEARILAERDFTTATRLRRSLADGPQRRRRETRRRRRQVRGLSLHVGDRRLFDNLSLTVPGGRVPLLGAAPANQPAAGDGSGARHLRRSGRQRWATDSGRSRGWGRKICSTLAERSGQRRSSARGCAVKSRSCLSPPCLNRLSHPAPTPAWRLSPAACVSAPRWRARWHEDRPIVLMDEPFGAGYPHPYAHSDRRPPCWPVGAYHPRSAGGLPVEPPPAGPLGADGDIDDSHHLAGTPSARAGRARSRRPCPAAAADEGRPAQP